MMKIKRVVVIAAFVAAALAALTAERALQAAPGGPCVINQAATKQIIRGFGGSSAWHGELTDAEADTLFTALGLSILRVRIDPGGAWADEIVNAQKAQARGALVFASPWSPPAWMKSNASTINGSLLPQHYGDYVNWLNSFASNIPGLYAVSVQNEPNLQPAYESCSWTEQQLFDFIVNFGQSFSTRLMMPETFNYLPSYSDSILSNPAGAANTSICAYHWYGANRNQLWTQAYNLGKDIWMTEHFSNDQTMAAAITTAIDIQKQLTINFANAYVWWWVREPSCNIIEPGGATVHRRGYVLGQYAKFVRPGSVRVDATGGASGTYISAFVSDGKLVVVAVNSGSSPVAQSFTIQGGTATAMTPYATSDTESLTPGASIAVSNGSFSATLGRKSVTTFVQN
jgi:glucuronoarabinoxylan endo-1,4-beta-xylanase